MISKEDIQKEFQAIQDEICNAIEAIDGKSKFVEDKWERPGGGGGRTRVILEGNVLQKGGVNFSAVHGELPDFLKKELQTESNHFLATGVSIVLHPHNPHVPIIHMNIRYFEMEDGTFWFGGGIDLTPHYVSRRLAKSFHHHLKEVCDHAHPDFYPEYKKWADDYFFNVHRNETRGVGGIFFDRLNDKLDKDGLFKFVCELGRRFIPIYEEQVKANRDKVFSESEKQWQLIRRGRYVEFNLVYDRGTKFGLQTNGRIESILMSLPTEANWYYNHQPEAGTAEAETLAQLKKEINWLEA